MSLATQITVTAALMTDPTLDSLLPRDPKAPTTPAIFKGSHGKRMPVYPCITYRIQQETPDARFQPDIAAGGGLSPISEETLEIEVWTESGSATKMDALVQGVRECFDGRALELQDAQGQPAGRVHWCTLISLNQDLFDSQLGVYFSLLRFRLRVDSSANL